MRFWFWGIRAKFILFSLAVLSPVVIIAYFLIRESTMAVSDQLRDRGNGTAERYVADLDWFLRSTTQFLAAEAALPAFKEGDSEALDRSFRQIIPIYENRFLNVFATDKQGRVTASAIWDTNQPQTITDLPEFATLKRTSRPVISSVTRSISTGQPSILVLYPILASFGAPFGESPNGALGAEVSLQQLQRTLVVDDQAGTEMVIVADRLGRVIVLSGFRYMENQTDLRSMPLVATALERRRGTMNYRSPDGEEWVAAYTVVPRTGWTVIVAYSQTLADRPAREILLKGLLWLGASILFAVVVAVLLANRVTSAVRRLAESAHAIAAGNLDHQIHIRSRDEFQQLAEDFSLMSASLSQTLTRLRQSELDRQERAAHLQRLLGQTLSAQEEERRRIASDLHDGVVQTVLGGLYAMQAATGEVPPRAAADLGTAHALFLRAADELNRLVRNMRPRVLEVAGLEGALKDFLTTREKLPGIVWSLRIQGEVHRLPAQTEIAIYRIIQEAIGNAEKHSSASTGEIELDFGPDSLRVVVRDHGRGFNLDEVGQRSDGRLGLVSMQERALGIGADLHIVSSIGSGTLIYLEIGTVVPVEGLEGSSEVRAGGRYA